MSKQFNALFMNIVLTLAKLLALVRSRICQNACICTDTHFISLVFGVAHKTIFQTIEAFFFLHLSPITCAVSISWNLSHQEKIDVKTNTTFRLYAAYGLVTERARENVYEIEDFFSLVREYACIICTNYLKQRERATSQCVIKEESIHVYFMAINISDMCLHYNSNSNTDAVAKFYLFV